jgi:hypothetical protein
MEFSRSRAVLICQENAGGWFGKGVNFTQSA